MRPAVCVGHRLNSGNIINNQEKQFSEKESSKPPAAKGTEQKTQKSHECGRMHATIHLLPSSSRMSQELWHSFCPLKSNGAYIRQWIVRRFFSRDCLQNSMTTNKDTSALGRPGEVLNWKSERCPRHYVFPRETIHSSGKRTGFNIDSVFQEKKVFFAKYSSKTASCWPFMSFIVNPQRQQSRKKKFSQE